MASYRYLSNKNHGLEANYGYSLNTQIYSAAGAAVVVPFNRWPFFALAGTGAIIFDAKDMHGVGHQA